MKLVISFLVFLFPVLLFAQPFSMEGKVIDASTKQPVKGATVFINRSLKATLSDQEGTYSFDNIPDKSFEIIVSHPGYETVGYRAQPSKQKTLVQFELHPAISKPAAYDEKLWDKWGLLFLSNLLGTTINALECEVVNPEVLRFNFNDTTKELAVTSVDMLRIVNEGLGYMVNYRVDDFRINTVSGKRASAGYVHFKPLTTKRPEIAGKWSARRTEAYNGSLQHFSASLYKSDLLKEGFEVRRLQRFFEGQEGYTTARRPKDATVFSSGELEKDGVKKKYVDLVEKDLLDIDSFRVFNTSTNECFLKTDHVLQVIYNKEKESIEYLARGPRPGASGGYQSSYIYLLKDVAVQPSGLCIDEQDVVVTGHMGWELLSELLPAEYAD